MAGTFSVDKSNVTIDFKYKTTLDNGQTIIYDAAHLLWDRGMGNHGDDEKAIEFESLSALEKLAIVDKYVLRVIVDLANQYKTEAAQIAAREAVVNYKMEA